MKTLLLLAAPLAALPSLLAESSNPAPTLPLATFLEPSLPGACLWDRDTLRMEAEGQDALLFTLLGRFDRFPAEYYGTRLRRVRKEIAQGTSWAPASLALYDDAGVACDRIGRAEEALQWMEKKRTALDGLEKPDAFHEYTYLANLGTFHIHRWLRAGKDRSDLADVERAHTLIAKAIELNPDAHFGRERYQLLALEDLLGPQEKVVARSLLTRIVNEPIYAAFSQKDLDEAGYSDAVEGVSGLIRLGAAWDSAAIWFALENALLAKHDSFLARLASLRVCEIARKGQVYHPYPGFAEKDQLDQHRATVHDKDLEVLDAWWKQSREVCERWRTSRNEYLMSRLNLGLHPDTHPDFWSAWEDKHPLPKMAKKSLMDKLIGR